MNDWYIFKGNPEQTPHDAIDNLPPPPSWRPFGEEIAPGVNRRKRRGETFIASEKDKEMVNAALYLRRPLLITGTPGTGKSSLIYAVARELKLGEVLYWPITTRTTLKDGLYNYDAIGRLQDARQNEQSAQRRLAELKFQTGQINEEEFAQQFGLQTDELKRIENYIRLGPLGTALLPSDRPRVLLIDEIDKSDIDLPNDLLTVFEEGRFEIPELTRIEEQVERVSVRTAYTDEDEAITKDDIKAEIVRGRISCKAFPFVVLTSNGERDFPPPFLRRCLRLDMLRPQKADLERIVQAHFKEELKRLTVSSGRKTNSPQFKSDIDDLIEQFLNERETKNLATDQLLNAIFLLTREHQSIKNNKQKLIDQILRSLSNTGDIEP